MCQGSVAMTMYANGWSGRKATRSAATPDLCCPNLVLSQ
jgi:hypothetical protein